MTFKTSTNVPYNGTTSQADRGFLASPPFYLDAARGSTGIT